MRTLVVGLTLAVSCATAYGQDYFPFTGDDTRTWTSHIGSSPYGDCLETTTTSYWFEGSDTLIDGFLYKRIRTRVRVEYSTILVFCEGLTEFPGPDVFVREEEQKVFAKESSMTSEQLVYDFNAAVGDTLPSPAFGNMEEWDLVPVVLGIDSVLIGATYRKRFMTSESCVIEGIGGCHGPFNLLQPGGLSYIQELDCVREGSIVVFGNSDCAFFTSTADLAPTAAISVFPNPTTGLINVMGEFDHVIVRDVTGRTIGSSQTRTIGLEARDSGVYFLDFFRNGRIVSRHAVVLEGK